MVTRRALTPVDNPELMKEPLLAGVTDKDPDATRENDLAPDADEVDVPLEPLLKTA